ncbi:hypothetical protein [Burkholderia sp. PAMC 26561]|uniref:hypothetical protein n=1 Tax=Burkholderia sp. PAMC 26561 TaxID=1795043 RepID=UPI00076B3D02|nr:hypothetical protein [Burkholderia sp. PAMC 26561]AME27127.1 hypothetical protein AXG89_24670 [Burkholderia sp. PAMC 26561]AME27724.1 hypothetical protein AXG89_28020 [Burkholderia sp. PAMC 26561]
MNGIELDPKRVLVAESQVPSGKPVTMINLVQFNDHAQYGDTFEKPCSGMEAYLQRYAPIFNEVAALEQIEGIEIVYLGNVASTILGTIDPIWDAVALVRYPTFKAFRKIIESPLYRERAEKHRKAALKAWEFIATYQP